LGSLSNKNITQSEVNKLTHDVIGAAITVHKKMGRGLLESVYHECMKEELKRRNINFFTELTIPAHYFDKKPSVKFRCDLFVENCLVIELKAVRAFSTEFEAKLLNHMRLLTAPKGILINFNCSNIFYEGQKTFVNEYFKMLEP
jgi:GxxExxY protein